MKKFIALVSCLALMACQQDDVKTVNVSKTTFDLSLQSTGELASSDTVTIGPPMVKRGWQQKITYLIPEGTWVKKGQKIVAFDAQQQMEFLREANNKLAQEKQKLQSQNLDNEQNEQQMKLDVAEAKMNLTKAQRKAEQDGDYAAQLEVKKLAIELKIAEKAYALSQFKHANKIEQAEVEQEITKAEVARLQAEVNEYKKALGSLTIKAPKDGIVVYVPDHDGSKPAEGDQVYVARKVIELPNLDKMIVKTTIPEQDISRVTLGQAVKIKLDAIPDKRFSGKVSSLGQVVRIKSRQEPSMVFDAEITIDNPDVELMRPGMAARLNIIEKQLNDVVSLPESSVHYSGDKSFVFIKSMFGQSEKPVQIVGRQNGRVLVEGEIDSGDEVVL